MHVLWRKLSENCFFGRSWEFLYDSIHKIVFNCTIAFCHYRDVMTIALDRRLVFLILSVGNKSKGGKFQVMMGIISWWFNNYKFYNFVSKILLQNSLYPINLLLKFPQMHFARRKVNLKISSLISNAKMSQHHRRRTIWIT